jgi:hypothetical protein
LRKPTLQELRSVKRGFSTAEDGRLASSSSRERGGEGGGVSWTPLLTR